jgi:hypothetical protein
MTIIAYIHICQIGEWKRSFTMIMDEMVTSGLYNAVSEIRCGVLNESGTHVYDENYILNESMYPSTNSNANHRKIIGTYTCNPLSKLRIIYIGTPSEYERPTLLHMKKSAETDPPNTKYLYTHTKGIRWFGTQIEERIIDWIKLLIYWNIEHWCNAIDVLNKYDTYGCNYHSSIHPPHYSGNFFWTTSYHLKELPGEIGPKYNDTEFWVCSYGKINGRPNVYTAFNSEFESVGHYGILFPESLYRT